MNKEQFLEYVRESCEKNGVEFIVTDNSRVHYSNIACNGFFDPDIPVDIKAEHIVEKTDFKSTAKDVRAVLAFSTGGKTEKEALELLAHEFCHLCQYVEKSPLWISQEIMSTFDRWLNGEDFEDKVLRQSWEKIVMLEADCERRVFKLAKELNLNIDPESYARNANSYLYFYSWCLDNRQWYVNAPYQIKEITDAMPNKIHEDVSIYVSDGLLSDKSLYSLFNQCVESPVKTLKM